MVTAATVGTVITAIGQMIALAIGVNPTKLHGTENKLLPRLSQIFDGWRKVNPPPMKKLSVESDAPEYLCHVGQLPTATPLGAAIGDLTLIAFYYLLRVSKYTTKGSQNSSKQTVQFKLKDVTFFAKITGEIYANWGVMHCKNLS
jgi:hypothetical protein